MMKQIQNQSQDPDQKQCQGLLHESSIEKEVHVLEEALNIIQGARAAAYGPPEKCNSAIAQQWSLYLKQKYGGRHVDVLNLTAEDVSWMMADLKKVRQMNSHKRDNIVDAAGYIGLISVD